MRVVSSKIFHFELVGFVPLKIGIVQKVDSFIILIIGEVCFKCIQIAYDNWLVLTRNGKRLILPWERSAYRFR